MPWIVDEIERCGGAVSFHQFMELTLYHPLHGYYSSPSPRFGREGDFMTAATASRWYATVLAHCLESLAATLGPLSVVDVASGDGSFVDQLASAAQAGRAEWLRGVVSVERSRTMRGRQEERLAGSPVTVEVSADLAEVRRPEGAAVVHACELYDALPVHRVVALEEGLRELWVARGPDGLQWQQRPAPEELAVYLADHAVELVPGQVAELNLAARPTHCRLLAWAAAPAVAFVLDYGYEARRLYDPRARGGGSLACYQGHALGRDPLADPGEQDVTAHVNWDDLRRAGDEAGWREVGLWPLAEFLVRAGLADALSNRGLGMEAELTADTVTERQEVKRLLDPDGMGSDLKVLVQASPDAYEVVSEVLELSVAP
jgi:SAM-dependent MidA family methyltransferase